MAQPRDAVCRCVCTESVARFVGINRSARELSGFADRATVGTLQNSCEMEPPAPASLSVPLLLFLSCPLSRCLSFSLPVCLSRLSSLFVLPLSLSLSLSLSPYLPPK